MLIDNALLRFDEIRVRYDGAKGFKRREITAVDGVTLSVGCGETLGLVGESGCGKSTLAKAILGLVKISSGQMFFGGNQLHRDGVRRSSELRSQMQLVFQNPKGALNPMRKVGRSLEAAALLGGSSNRAEARGRVLKILEEVGLEPLKTIESRPWQLSGGQCQRICIARALLVGPKLLICDEPVASLDAIVQVQIIDLLARMKAQHNLTMLFISHDLAVVRRVSDRVAVMYMGRLCEMGSSEEVYSAPAHPYTAMLLGAIPHIGKSKSKRTEHRPFGEMPSALNPPSGCRFRTRCDKATAICSDEEPQLTEIGNHRYAACHHPLSF